MGHFCVWDIFANMGSERGGKYQQHLQTHTNQSHSDLWGFSIPLIPRLTNKSKKAQNVPKLPLKNRKKLNPQIPHRERVPETESKFSTQPTNINSVAVTISPAQKRSKCVRKSNSEKKYRLSHRQRNFPQVPKRVRVRACEQIDCTRWRWPWERGIPVGERDSWSTWRLVILPQPPPASSAH